MIKLKLIPRKQGKWVDMIEIRDMNNTPAALIHIDTLWEKGGNPIYDALNKEQDLVVELTIIEDKK